MLKLKTQRAKRTFGAVDPNVCFADNPVLCSCSYCGHRNPSQIRHGTRDAPDFSKLAVQAPHTRRILGRHLAAIVFNHQPVQECLRALRHRLIRKNEKVTRVFNSDIR